MISTSPKKEKEAREALGADHFVVSKDEAQMSASHSHITCFLLERMSFGITKQTLFELQSRMPLHCHVCYMLPACAPLDD